MAKGPFQTLPNDKFLIRMAVPMAITFFLAFPVIGTLATSELMINAERKPSTLAPTPVVFVGDPSQVAVAHLAKVYNYWTHIPEACWSGNAVNSFQKTQCDSLWDLIMTSTAIGVIPFLPVLLIALILSDQLKGFYRRMRKKIQKGAVGKGTVTEPALAPNDFFGFYFCLRAVSVEMPNRQQIRVYLPLDVPVPLPGQQLALYEAGKFFGAKRYVALLYAPHLAVVRGS